MDSSVYAVIKKYIKKCTHPYRRFGKWTHTDEPMPICCYEKCTVRENAVISTGYEGKRIHAYRLLGKVKLHGKLKLQIVVS